YAPPTLDTNQLWLAITNLADGLAWLNLYNATNQVYAIWTTTDLLSAWNVELELWPTNPAVMPFTLSTTNRQSLFVLAEDWTGVTHGGNTTPDWWLWKYFGMAGLTMADTNMDNQGVA